MLASTTSLPLPTTGVWLRRARLAWIALALTALVPSVLSWPVYYGVLRTVCATCPVTPAYAQALQSLGLSVPAWAGWQIGKAIVITLGWAGVGLLIFARRSDDYRALLMSALLVLVAPGFGGLPHGLGAARPAWLPLVQVTNFLTAPCLLGLIFTFPNGLLSPRWTAWLLVYLVAVFSPNSFFPRSPLAFGNWPVWANGVFVFIPFLASMLVIPIYRYWRVFTPVERQQTKWAVLGFVAAFAGIGATLAVSVPYIDSAPQGDAFLVAGDLIQDVGYTLAPLMIPLFIGVAILRSRLWDIDVIIRRTLIYSALTGLLAAAYFGAVLVSESLLRAVTGQAQNTLATVVSTLAIAALIVPLRRRVQAFIDRRFYRQKYDAAQTIAAFAAAARDEVELDRLTAHMLGVVSDTLKPASVSLWLRPPVPNLNQRPWID